MQKFTAEEIADADLKANKNYIATYITIECGNLKVIKLLLDKKVVNITTVIVKAAAANKISSKEVMILLL